MLAFIFKNLFENREVGGDISMRTEKCFVVRKAMDKDVEGVIEVLTSTRLQDGAWTADKDWTQKALQKFLKTENYTMFVAESDGKVVGFIGYIVFPSFWECANQGFINDFFVHKDFQGEDIGSKLIEAVVERADREGLDELHVSTGWNNKRARRLYEKFGFTEEQLLLERHQKSEQH
jgi:ribosomal protein S18 acetylase RimI-like enzyme